MNRPEPSDYEKDYRWTLAFLRNIYRNDRPAMLAMLKRRIRDLEHSSNQDGFRLLSHVLRTFEEEDNTRADR